METMSPILIVLALAVLVGLVARGSFRHFEHLEIHWWGLALAGVGLQLLPVPTVRWLSGEMIGSAMLVASYLLLLAFLGVNRWIRGAAVMAIGLLLNLVVVGSNGGMPVSASAVERAGGSPTVLAEGEAAKHHVADGDDLFVPLGDVIPIPQPIGVVLSIGDVLLYLGMAWCVIQVMRGRSRENPRPLAMWFPSYRGKHAPVHWRMPARYRARDRAEGAQSGTEP
jgi:hypothetical protein